MKLRDFLRVALNSFMANKLRTFLSVLGIVIGIASVIMMVAIGTGAQRQITDRIGALGSNLITIYPNIIRGQGGSISQEAQNVFTVRMASQIEEAVAGIKNVVPMVQTGTLAVYKDTNLRTTMVGVTPAYAEVTNHHPLIGRYIYERDLEENAKVVVLGFEVAKNLFGDEIPIGKEIRISVGAHRLSLLVVGVMEEKGQVMFSNYDSQIFIPVTTLLNRALRTSYVNGFSVQCESGDMAKTVVQELEYYLSRRLGSTDSFRVMSQDTILQTASEATGTMTALLGAIAGIALIVGGIGIMNIMLVTVSERTREIGIRKAVGAKKWHILTQFLMESVTLSASGGLLGLGLGLAGGYLVSRVVNLPFAASPAAAVIAIAFSTCVGLFFGIYPASKAARLDPVEALRYE